MNLKKFIPNNLKHTIKSLLKITDEYILMKNVQKMHLKEIERIKKKNIIKIAFLVIHDSIWKYDELYKLYKNDDKYDPVVCIVPLVRNNNAIMNQYEQTKKHFLNNAYNVFETFDTKTNTWLDIDKVGADIIFFTNPHKLTFEKYHIELSKNKLTCYCPYAFVVIGEIWMHYGQQFHQLLWKYFVETEDHYNYSNQFSLSNNSNIIISGYPGLDPILKNNYNPPSPWKKTKTQTKKIIWAPHHTIEGYDASLNYSTFIENAESIFITLEENKKLQIAFKPHPILKENLYKHKSWGKEKTDQYYLSWKNHERGQLNESEYINLFFHSDAMITDSASFIAEYLYFDKPCFFSMKDKHVKERFNSFGKKIFDHLYQGKAEKDLLKFIESVVLNENDTLKSKRNVFYKNVILPKSNMTASENIFNEINRALC